MAVIGVLSGLSVFLFVVALLYPLVHRSAVVGDRLSNVAQGGGDSAVVAASVAGRGRSRGGLAPGTEGINGPSRLRSKRTDKTPAKNWLAEVELWLRRADIPVKASDFTVRWVLGTIVSTVFVALTPLVYVALLVPLLSALFTWVYLRMRMAKRLNQFNGGLYDLLILISNALRAGHSFVQALHLVAMESTGPIQDEVHRLEGELQMGVNLENALDRAAGRVGSEDFGLIVTAIGIQRQIGGNLAEVLERIAETIGERVKLKGEVKALTAQGRLSAIIFMVLPAGVGVLLYMINPGYIQVLFQSPLGIILLVVAGLGQGIGYLFIRRIVRIDL